MTGNSNSNSNIEITVKFRISNGIDRETLHSVFNGDLKHYVTDYLLDDESLFGIVDDVNDYVVTQAEEVKEVKA